MAENQVNRNRTETEYKEVIAECRAMFEAKLKDYGPAWRILRTPSLTDQIYIKAQRIRSFEDTGIHLISEGIRPEYIGIINYSVMALIQLEMGTGDPSAYPATAALVAYDRFATDACRLMSDKNHDYGEAWRNMRRSSLTDIILMKLLRIKQIEDNQGKTHISEGVDANYYDIINYSVFALIKLNYEIA